MFFDGFRRCWEGIAWNIKDNFIIKSFLYAVQNIRITRIHHEHKQRHLGRVCVAGHLIRAMDPLKAAGITKWCVAGNALENDTDEISCSPRHFDAGVFFFKTSLRVKFTKNKSILAVWWIARKQSHDRN